MNHKIWLPYTINHLNFGIAKKNLRVTLLFNKSTFQLVKLFKKSGLIASYVVLKKSSCFFIIIYVYYYKTLTLFKHSKLISTASKSFFISKRMLNLLNKKLGGSILFISSNKGIITQKDALTSNIGGKMLLLLL